MNRARWRPALLAPALLLLLADPALAGEGRDALMGFVVIPGGLALFAFPVGLAVHALILAFAPQRGYGLVHRAEAHRGKTLILGLANTVFLFALVFAVGKRAEALGLLFLATWVVLALVGSHGQARSLGARILGWDHGTEPPPPEDLRCLAVGWGVLVFGSVFPVLGLGFMAYHALRSVGGVVLSVFSVPEPERAPPPL